MGACASADDSESSQGHSKSSGKVTGAADVNVELPDSHSTSAAGAAGAAAAAGGAAGGGHPDDVFGDTVRLVLVTVLRRLSQVLCRATSGYSELACRLYRKECSSLDLIAGHKQFADLFKACFELRREPKDIEPAGIDKNDIVYVHKKFEAVLDAVERAPWKKPGPAMLIKHAKGEHWAALQAATAATRDALEKAIEAIEGSQDDEMAALRPALLLFVHVLRVFDGADIAQKPQIFYDQIDKCIAKSPL